MVEYKQGCALSLLLLLIHTYICYCLLLLLITLFVLLLLLLLLCNVLCLVYCLFFAVSNILLFLIFCNKYIDMGNKRFHSSKHSNKAKFSLFSWMDGYSVWGKPTNTPQPSVRNRPPLNIMKQSVYK